MTSIFKTFSMILLAMTVATAVVFSSPVLAQGSSAEKPPAGGPRRQLGTIIYAGLGGAVLGLSTLSFYGRPQDKLANIAIGFAVGVIGGTVAVTFSAVTAPDEFYGAQNSREILLGPPPSMSVVATSSPSEASREISGTFEILSFR